MLGARPPHRPPLTKKSRGVLCVDRLKPRVPPNSIIILLHNPLQLIHIKACMLLKRRVRGRAVPRSRPPGLRGRRRSLDLCRWRCRAMSGRRVRVIRWAGCGRRLALPDDAGAGFGLHRRVWVCAVLHLHLHLCRRRYDPGLGLHLHATRRRVEQRWPKLLRAL
ncbi:hypothetical protein C8F04DRAFT_1128095 [Mycena alexandri]|uniref:Uncharacterized protein n=1 Tax=Mycena alexandri TaxID=1745969 RepID=A0AAD6WUT2_9AGAR|nr:hypothetical protein C8F04DRAFT_1128095 [Mycena alexandri]